MAVPALCEKCGQWFTNPLFVAKGGTVIAEDGAKINHLGCGGFGVIPAGEYKFTEDGVRAVLDAGLTKEEIEKLIALLEDERDSVAVLANLPPDTPPEIVEVIRDHLPADPVAAKNARKALATALAIAVAGYGVHTAHQDAESAHHDAREQVTVTRQLDRDRYSVGDVREPGPRALDLCGL
jgi:hypothetical protein